jgi:hypothetical protein
VRQPQPAAGEDEEDERARRRELRRRPGGRQAPAPGALAEARDAVEGGEEKGERRERAAEVVAPGERQEAREEPAGERRGGEEREVGDGAGERAPLPRLEELRPRAQRRTSR